MAKIVLKDPFVSINSIDLSNRVKEVEIAPSREMLDSSAGGDDWQTFLAGLKTWAMRVTFFQDMAAANVDATLWALFISDTEAPVEVRAVKTGGRSATNPGFSGNALLEGYPPVGGQHGQILMAPATFRGSGALSRLTS